MSHQDPPKKKKNFPLVRTKNSTDLVLTDTSIGPQKKEVLCNAVGKLCATITTALSTFMHEVSGLEGGGGEASSSLGGKHAAKNGERRDQDEVLPEDSSELPTEDTSADEYGDETSADGEGEGGSSADDDSEDDPEGDADWEEEQLNTSSSRQKHGETEPGNGPSKFFEHCTRVEGSGHGSGDKPEENQEPGNGCTRARAVPVRRASSPVVGERSTRRKTGEEDSALVAAEKTVVHPITVPLHEHGEGKPTSSCVVLCADTRPLKVGGREEEDMERRAVIDLCTPTSSES